MKALLVLFMVFSAYAQKDEVSVEMQKRLANYKTKMSKITSDLKATAEEFCAKKVDIACKMKNGQKASPEESYDAGEIALFKEAEKKAAACKEDNVCKVKVSHEQMEVAIKRFEAKCKKGDTKYCFNQKLFKSIAEGTAVMEAETKWLAENNKKKK